MTGGVAEFSGHKVFVCAPTGPTLTEEAALAAVIGAACGAGVQMVVLPLSRLGADFLDLSTGMAGALLQKFIAYRLRVALVGDTTDDEAKSKPLRDFVFETNRGMSVWFCPDMPRLQQRIADGGQSSQPLPARLQVWA